MKGEEPKLLVAGRGSGASSKAAGSGTLSSWEEGVGAVEGDEAVDGEVAAESNTTVPGAICGQTIVHR